MLHTFLYTKKWRIAVFALAVLIALVVLLLWRATNAPLAECETSGVTPSIVLHDTHIALTLAQTPAEWERGLSGHAPFGTDEGMLFLFDKSTPKQFWMKDMLFPIDIIWISPEWKVNAWVADAQPESYPKTFTSPDNTQYVLEVPAGTAKRLSLRSGEVATFLACGTKKE